MKCDNSIFVVSFTFLLIVVSEKVAGENDKYFESESDEPQQNFAAANFHDDDDLQKNFAESSTSAPSNFAPNNFAAASLKEGKFPNYFAAPNFQNGDPQAIFAQNARPFYLNPGQQQQPLVYPWFGPVGPVIPNGGKWNPQAFGPLGPYPVDPNVKVSGYSYGYKYTTDQNGNVVVSPLGAPGAFPSSFSHNPLTGSLSGSSQYEDLWNPRNRIFETDNIRKSDPMFGFDDKAPNTHQILKTNGPQF